MTLLQPSDVPSRSGINNAITSEIAAHASLTNTAGLHYDSGWILIPLRANFQASGENPSYRRIGSVIYLRGRVQPINGVTWSTANTAWGDLPAGFVPSTPNVLFASTSGSPGVAARFFITSAGVCNANLLSGTGTGAIHLSCAYPN
jgi:hypothetical protein